MVNHNIIVPFQEINNEYFYKHLAFFDLGLVTTTPNVIYQIKTKEKQLLIVDTPSKMPDISEIDSIMEPIVFLLF
jgi:translation elongation factor EF-4